MDLSRDDITKILNDFDLKNYDCDYVDIRVEKEISSSIIYRDSEIIECCSTPSLGVFIRVYNNNLWYYLSTTKIYELDSEILKLVEESQFRSGADSAKVGRPYNEIPNDSSIIKFERNSFSSYSMKEKNDLIKSYLNIYKASKVMSITASYKDYYKLKWFKSSKNVRFIYDINQAEIVFSYTLADGEKRFSDYSTIGGSKFDSLKNRETFLTRELEESIPFLNAEIVKPGKYPVVLDYRATGVFAHESFGHTSEADSIVEGKGGRDNWRIGDKVGNDNLSIVDSGEDRNGSGYCPIDDEGYPAKKNYLIKNGILSGRLHSAETAIGFNESPTGNARAINFEFEPIPRMTNTYIEPGSKTFEDIISSVKLGLYAVGIKSGLGGINFSIAPQKGYWIRNGKIEGPVIISVIRGNLFETLNLVEACSNNFELIFSLIGCGKNGQFSLPVGLGGPEVLISEMAVS